MLWITQFPYEFWQSDFTPKPGPHVSIKTVFARYGIAMLNIRRSRDRLVFNMGGGDPYTGKTTYLYWDHTHWGGGGGGGGDPYTGKTTYLYWDHTHWFRQ